MALDIHDVRFLLAARKKGLNCDRVVTFGRLHLNVYPHKVAEILKAEGLPFDPDAVPLIDGQAVAEPFFRAIGAREVVSLDISDYQGATLLHDMNLPIPDTMRNQFDLLFDGGSLEHIFNFPTAIKNCMEMVRPGGSIIIHTVANNSFGHGFYQFSAELFYRIFSEENGYTVDNLIVHMVGPYGRWYQVADPEKIKERVQLITWFPVLLLVQARKLRDVPVFTTPPQQSDFAAWWKEVDQAKAQGAISQPRVRPPGFLEKRLPGLARLVNVIRMGWLFYSTQRLGNRKFYTPVAKR
jgi:SAM-dependent methyltransferase